MHNHYSDQQLQAYLDEALPAEQMSAVEHALRNDAQLQDKLIELLGRREAGVHGLGEIWRRNRISCPTRSQLGSYLLAAMDPAQAAYIAFHLEQVGCRLCLANLQDLQQQQSAQTPEIRSRRQRYFQTSAGYLKRER